MSFTAKDVQELRARTGAGMMDCKKALEANDGDTEKAIEFLRAKGIAKAETRAGRTASEGRIVALVADDARTAAILELNCETDFVGRNDEFVALTTALAEQVLADESLDGTVRVASEGNLLAQPWKGDPSKTVDQMVKEASARTGENLVVRRYARFVSDGALGAYVHHNGKVAALVDITGSKSAPAIALAKQIAEHAAAGVPTVPLSVSKDEVPAEAVEKERRIFTEQAKASGKPDNIIQKMIEGRIAKYFTEVALVEQPWVRDDKQSIRQLVAAAGLEAGSSLLVHRFARFQMGEE